MVGYWVGLLPRDDKMFTKSAAFYDAIYAWKDYEAEAQHLHELIQHHGPAWSLLDVACGTGAHLTFLRANYVVEGLDLNPEMLAIARAHLPGVPFHLASMLDFDLGRHFDVVTCLFGSIGYSKTVPAMRQAVAAMARHVNRNGLLIIEPWLTPEAFTWPRLSAQFVDLPDLKIARISRNALENRLSILDFRYLVGTPTDIDYFTERHELGLFTSEDLTSAFEACGLQVSYDEKGLNGRGLYVGVQARTL